MHYPSPWEYEISVIRHHEYERKPVFEKEADQYEEWSAFAVTDGAFRFEIGGTEGSAAAGQLVVCPPGLLFRRYTEQPISFHYFLFHWLDRQGKPCLDRIFQAPTHMSFRTDERLLSTLNSLRSPSSTMHSPVYRLWLNHALLDIFRFYSTEQSAQPEPDPLPLTDPAMEEARALLDAACDVPITIGEVADRLGLTPVQFARRFEKASGMKPSAYVERMKLDKVCHLLTHTRMTLERIALASGFSNGFYLSRYFTKKMGVSPSEYRNQFNV